MQHKIFEQHCGHLRNPSSRSRSGRGHPQGCICMTAGKASARAAANASPVPDSKVRDIPDTLNPSVRRMFMSDRGLLPLRASTLEAACNASFALSHSCQTVNCCCSPSQCQQLPVRLETCNHQEMRDPMVLSTYKTTAASTHATTTQTSMHACWQSASYSSKNLARRYCHCS